MTKPDPNISRFSDPAVSGGDGLAGGRGSEFQTMQLACRRCDEIQYIVEAGLEDARKGLKAESRKQKAGTAHETP
jgi:hypothetical protein